MPIVRKGPGSRERSAKPELQKRSWDDFEFGWGDVRVFVLDEHEWFDPHTSTNYEDGVSRHAMYGPAAIYLRDSAGSSQAVEYHVNDPDFWAIIRSAIAQGRLTADSMVHVEEKTKEGVSAHGQSGKD